MKDEWNARMGIVFTDYLKFLTPLLIIVPGLLAPRLFPGLEKPDEIFPTLVRNLLPTGLVGLVMAGLIAAVKVGWPAITTSRARTIPPARSAAR